MHREDFNKRETVLQRRLKIAIVLFGIYHVVKIIFASIYLYNKDSREDGLEQIKNILISGDSTILCLYFLYFFYVIVKLSVVARASARYEFNRHRNWLLVTGLIISVILPLDILDSMIFWQD